MKRCALCGDDTGRVYECHVPVESFGHLERPDKSSRDQLTASCGWPVLRKGADGRWVDLKTGHPIDLKICHPVANS